MDSLSNCIGKLAFTLISLISLADLASAAGFLASSAYLSGDTPVWVAIADFNRDGHLDVATANQLGSNVSILLNNGDGTFAQPKDFAAGQNPFFVLAADVNGDSNPDLVAFDQNGFSLLILLGNGDGTFQPGLVVSVGVQPSFMAISTSSDKAVDSICRLY